MNSKGTPSARLAELDALRGIAALCVVGFHYTTRYDEVYHHVGRIPFSVPWGHYGVELFFAISGFVIFMTLEKTVKPMDFIVSRFSRLYPAYWAAMALTTAVVYLGGLRDQQIGVRGFLENLPMIQTLIANMPSVDGSYWTLGIELCFYGCMFLLFLSGRLKRIEAYLLAWIGLKWIWAFFPHLSWMLGELVIQKYIPFFAIGVVSYRLHTRASSEMWALAILSFAIVTVFILDGIAMGSVACLVTGIFMLFIYGYATWLRSKPLLALGAISYPLYLLHENIGRTIMRNMEARGLGESLALPVALLAVLILASLTTLLIERPTLAWIRSAYRKAKETKPVLQRA